MKTVCAKAARGALAAALVASCLALAACGGSSATTYKDGTYTGESSVLDANVDGDGYAVVSVTVENGQIVAATVDAYQVDGTPKDQDYGKDGAYYALAQKAVSAGEDYAAALVETGAVEGVDVVSGATYLHDQFVEAAQNALDQAAE